MNPKYITVHCSATSTEMHDIGANEIRRMHLKKGWSDIGYHYVITRNGQIQSGRPKSRTGAHVKGHNKNNLGVCLVGGIDENGKPEDNFTVHQFSALRFLIVDQVGMYGIKQENIKGHRDWFPDFNGDGVIDSRDWLKACPCFDVQDKLKEWG